MQVHRPPRASLEFAAKAAVAAALAMWVAQRLGLKDPYWAGISAVIGSAGTLGASLGASISRISATVVGLIVGLAVVALPIEGTLLSALAVFLALVLLAALSLDAGGRLGAATTLIVTASPGDNAVTQALARGANVPLGCVIAVAVGLVLWPHRAVRQLRTALQADVGQAGALAQAALLVYLGASVDDQIQLELEGLVRRRPERAAAMRDAAREPELFGERLLTLRSDVATVEALVDTTGALLRPCLQGAADSASALVGAELERVATAIAAAARAVGSARDDGLQEPLAELTDARSALDTAFAQVRANRQTVTVQTSEVARLFSVIRGVHEVSSVLSQLQER